MNQVDTITITTTLFSFILGYKLLQTLPLQEP
jgi:hypothetical protein